MTWVVPGMNSKVFGGKNGGEGWRRMFFVYFDIVLIYSFYIVFSRRGREWHLFVAIGVAWGEFNRNLYS